MIEVGRVCLKIAGRDSGNFAVVISAIDGNLVMIDGNVRRKKCNLKHLEPTSKLLEIKENAPTEQVLAAMKEAGIEVKEHKKGAKERTKGQKAKRQRKAKAAAAEAKPKKAVKKEKK